MKIGVLLDEQGLGTLASTSKGTNYVVAPDYLNEVAIRESHDESSDSDGVITIPDFVPEVMRGLWVEHERKCKKHSYQICSHLSCNDIRQARKILSDELYMQFLSLRFNFFLQLMSV